MGQLRIIAGRLKGRRIRVPGVASVRPTGDRVREALFSILGSDVVGARVLDAYAGSGALGFEALSRGAAEIVFVEAEPAAARAVRASAEELGVSAACTVLEGRLERLAAVLNARGPFRLVLADPPYDDLMEVSRLLSLAAGVVDAGGTAVLERDSGVEAASGAGLRLERSARYGRARLDFYRLAGPGDG